MQWVAWSYYSICCCCFFLPNALRVLTQAAVTRTAETGAAISTVDSKANASDRRESSAYNTFMSWQLWQCQLTISLATPTAFKMHQIHNHHRVGRDSWTTSFFQFCNFKNKLITTFGKIRCSFVPSILICNLFKAFFKKWRHLANDNNPCRFSAKECSLEWNYAVDTRGNRRSNRLRMRRDDDCFIAATHDA